MGREGPALQPGLLCPGSWAQFPQPHTVGTVAPAHLGVSTLGSELWNCCHCDAPGRKPSRHRLPLSHRGTIGHRPHSVSTTCHPSAPAPRLAVLTARAPPAHGVSQPRWELSPAHSSPLPHSCEQVHKDFPRKKKKTNAKMSRSQVLDASRAERKTEGQSQRNKRLSQPS